MEAVFPLVKKYGGTVVALTLDESGIPETFEGRIAVAEKILDTAKQYGIPKKRHCFRPHVYVGQRRHLGGRHHLKRR